MYRVNEPGIKPACASFDGTSWVQSTPATGGGVTSHAALTGLTHDDHQQYLLADGERESTNGFAVAGTYGIGMIPEQSPGVRMMWYPRKASFRVGRAGFNWRDEVIGEVSFASGDDTRASGRASTALGNFTQATGSTSLAAMGSYALTQGFRESFVYGDNFFPGANNTADNQFTVRASGGFVLRTAADMSTGCNLPAGSGTWVCTSSRFAKDRFENLNGDDVLRKIGRMPVQAWSYRTEEGNIRHVGPTAQDLRAAFGLGTSDEAIALVDIDGINMLGIKALVRRASDQTRQIESLRAANGRQTARLAAQSERLKALESVNARQAARLAALEDAIARLSARHTRRER